MRDSTPSPRRHFGFLRVGLATLLAACTLPATADVTGEWRISDGQSMTVEYRDDDHMRLSVGNGSGVIVTGGEAYMVGRQGDSWQVIAAAEMQRAMKHMPQGMLNRGGQEEGYGAGPSRAEFEATGETETVAGIEGQRYRMVVQRGGSTERHEVVLTRDDRVVTLQRALVKLSQQSIKGLPGVGKGQLQNLPTGPQGEQGMLRVDDQMQLQSVSTASIPDQRFQLPAEPQSLGGLGGGGGPGRY